MNLKYDVISKGMFAIVKEMKETNRLFEEKMEKLEKRNEIVDTHIEKLLDILSKK
jgi:hypothetical protein